MRHYPEGVSGCQGLFVFPRGPLNQPSFPRKRESRTLGESVKSAGCTENEKALIGVSGPVDLLGPPGSGQSGRRSP